MGINASHPHPIACRLQRPPAYGQSSADASLRLSDADTLPRFEWRLIPRAEAQLPYWSLQRSLISFLTNSHTTRETYVPRRAFRCSWVERKLGGLMSGASSTQRSRTCRAVGYRTPRQLCLMAAMTARRSAFATLRSVFMRSIEASTFRPRAASSDSPGAPAGV
jgi:hypothetical protein